MDIMDKDAVMAASDAATPRTDEWFYEKKEPAKRKFMCTFSAFLGMLAALLVFVLYGIVAHSSYPLLFIFIPLGSLLFVHLFKCRNMKGAFKWIACFTVLGWYLAEVITASVSFAHVYGIPNFELLRIMSYMLFNSLLWNTIISESLYSFVFLLLSLWIAYEFTRGGHAPAGAEAPAVADTAETVEEEPESVEAAEEEEPEEDAEAEPEEADEEDSFDDEDEYETFEQFMANKSKE